MDYAKQIFEIEAIKQLKARYFRLMDTKDWDNWGMVFTEDATLQFDRAVSTNGRDGKPIPKVVGRENLVAMLRNSVPKQTVHHGHMPEIELLNETEATGIWSMEDIVDYGTSLIHGYGHYHETYSKTDGQWRIATVHLTRIRLIQQNKDEMMVVAN